jgi:ketosteroid isomerase-like protein
MKRRAFLAVAAAVPFAHSLRAAVPSEQTIVDAEKSWAKAVVASDVPALEKIMADDLIYGHSNGIVDDRKAYFDKLKAGTRYEAIDHKSITVRVYGETSAAAHCKVHMKGVAATGAFESDMMMLHVWVKRGGNWQLAAHQTCRVA